MDSGQWKQGGPTVMGYRPGWPWWAALLLIALVGGGLAFSAHQRHERIRRHIAERMQFHAAEQGIDAALVRAVVQAESGGDFKAQSNKGAKGLMQVTPIALEDVYRLKGEAVAVDLFDIDDNLHVGTVYLQHLLTRFDGDVTLAVAAYHMGPTRVREGQRKHPGLEPYDMVQTHAGPQTRAYLDKVLKLYQRYKAQ